MDKFLRKSVEHRLSSRDLDYYFQDFSLKPLSVIMSLLSEDCDKNKTELVLDAGCGIGMFEFLTYSDKDSVCQPTFPTVGVEIYYRRLEVANTLLKHNGRVHFVRSSISNLPFKEKVFQVTFVSDVFYELDLNLVLSEIARVTSSIMYFDIPTRFLLLVFPFLKPNPSYLTYDLGNIRRKLSSLGFGVTKILPAQLAYLTRTLRLPLKMIRALHAFLLALPPHLRNSLSALWPLIVLRARRLLDKRS